MSLRYIANGLSVFSPNLNAGVGDVAMSVIACRVLYNLLLAKQDKEEDHGGRRLMASATVDALRRVLHTLSDAFDQRNTQDDEEEKQEEEEEVAWRDLRQVVPQLERLVAHSRITTEL